MIDDVVLIGPMRAGKSTVAALLAERLALPRASLDGRGWALYAEVGCDVEKVRALREAEGELPAYRYFERFLLAATERHLRESRGCVVDLGAGHTVYEDPADLARVQGLLAPYRNVVLLLPSPDVEVSSAVLRARTRGIAWLERLRRESGVELNEWFLRHRSNAVLAKHTVYTRGRAPAETCEEVLALVRPSGPAA